MDNQTWKNCIVEARIRSYAGNQTDPMCLVILIFPVKIVYPEYMHFLRTDDGVSRVDDVLD